ncbi:hypothetical protein BH11PSE1_BH11PSE1_06330 [soil metagenome]
MNQVLACIDNSTYCNSVCDHAGWFASDPEVGVEVFHVVEDLQSAGPVSGAPSGDPLIERAVSRLLEEGVGPITSARVHGDFVEQASQRQANMIVMGKRGDQSQSERRTLGSSVDAMVRGCAKPICLASKYFLPIHRALVLLDADLEHRAALEFVVSEARLSSLSLDVLVVGVSGQDAEPKVEWARGRLKGMVAQVSTLVADGLDDAVTHYMQSGAADLVVISRAVVAPAPEAKLQLIEACGLWGARTPVLIC